MQSRKNISITKYIFILGEALLVNGCFLLCYFIFADSLSYNYIIQEKHFWLYFNLTYFLGILLVGVVLHKRIVTTEEILDRVIKQTLVHFALLAPLLLITNEFKQITFTYGSTLALAVFFISLKWRLITRKLLSYIRTRPKYIRPIIILGAGNLAQEVYKDIVVNKTNGYKLLGFFDNTNFTNPTEINGSLLKGNLNDVIPFLKKNSVHEIFCALPAGEDEKALPILAYAENNLIRFYLIPDFKRFLNKKVQLQFFNNTPIVSLRNQPLDSFANAFIKRSFDLLVSILFLLTVFPVLLLIIGIGVKLSSKGPIFFLQKRTGKNGKTFTCIKFRSMQVNDKADEEQATKDDLRVTRIGLLLRKTNLDETPQFINVLLGDMTIVGPRPHMLKHTAEYAKLVDKYMLRHLGKPGITGWAQVSGYRGEIKDIKKMEKRVKRDVWYLENWTFGLDLHIILKTIKLMLKGDEAAY